jgi:hypothetical protein
MHRILKASVVYFALVFGAGFVLGAVAFSGLSREWLCG